MTPEPRTRPKPSETDGFTADWKKFRATNAWRLQRRVWRDRDGEEHSTDELVLPRYSVTLDSGMSYKQAEIKPVDGPFRVNTSNGYVMHITNEAGQLVAMVPTKDRAGGISLEQAAWVAETIVAALNATQPAPDHVCVEDRRNQ